MTASIRRRLALHHTDESALTVQVRTGSTTVTISWALPDLELDTCQSVFVLKALRAHRQEMTITQEVGFRIALRRAYRYLKEGRRVQALMEYRPRSTRSPDWSLSLSH